MTLTKLEQIPTPNFGEGITLHTDEHGQYWMRVETRIRKGKPHGVLAPNCYPLCPFHKARPHLTCPNCVARTRHYGLRPKLFPVNIYCMALPADWKSTPWKMRLLKAIFTILENTLGVK